MVELKYDKVTNIEIGYDAANHVTITNVLYFAERVVSVDGDMVDELSMINDFTPGGIHQNHSYLELEMSLDTDWLTDTTNPATRWAYTQQTETGVAASRAIKEAAANSSIQWFLVTVREYDGSVTTLQYADEDTNVLWCTGETSEFTNEDGARHQPVTFKFICLQDVDRTEV